MTKIYPLFASFQLLIFSSLYDVFNLKIFMKNREVSNKIFNTLFDLDDKFDSNYHY